MATTPPWKKEVAKYDAFRYKHSAKYEEERREFEEHIAKVEKWPGDEVGKTLLERLPSIKPKILYLLQVSKKLEHKKYKVNISVLSRKLEKSRTTLYEHLQTLQRHGFIKFPKKRRGWGGNVPVLMQKGEYFWIMVEHRLRAHRKAGSYTDLRELFPSWWNNFWGAWWRFGYYGYFFLKEEDICTYMDWARSNLTPARHVAPLWLTWRSGFALIQKEAKRFMNDTGVKFFRVRKIHGKLRKVVRKPDFVFLPPLLVRSLDRRLIDKWESKPSTII